MDFPRPPKWKRVLKRTSLGLACVFAATVGAGFALQSWRDAHVPPAKGSFVMIDGRNMHYRVSGAGRCTFVLEAGLGDYSDSWGDLETGLAAMSRTFVYDRAGLGWSDSAPGPRSVGAIVDDLHRTLTAASIPKPYILVGHSFGGLTQTLYAQRYPSEVAGLLLIDPSHKDQLKV
jgi:pimeloyl-ACP methyl ester carboxylesterase